MDLHNLIDDLIENADYYEVDLEDMTIEQARDLLLVTNLELRKSYCEDCKLRIMDLEEYFMVHDHIWDPIAKGAYMLCIGCLEGRLGRLLTSADFTDCPLNEGHKIPGSFGSDRMRSRLLDMSEPAALK